MPVGLGLDLPVSEGHAQGIVPWELVRARPLRPVRAGDGHLGVEQAGARGGGGDLAEDFSQHGPEDHGMASVRGSAPWATVSALAWYPSTLSTLAS